MKYPSKEIKLVFINIWLRIKNVNKYGNKDLKKFINTIDIVDIEVFKLRIIYINISGKIIKKDNFKYFILSPFNFII